MLINGVLTTIVIWNTNFSVQNEVKIFCEHLDILESVRIKFLILPNYMQILFLTTSNSKLYL